MPLTSLFCRHNRFTADCPICSKNSVLGTREKPEPHKPARPRAAAKKHAAPPRAATGPFVSSGLLESGAEVRLEKVMGGLRMASWRSGAIAREAPVLPPAALRALLSEAGERGILGFDEWGRIEEALSDAVDGAAEPGVAASEGRAGDLKDALRVERLEDGSVRVGRWLYWPGGGAGWELQEAPPMLPAKRYVEALAAAAKSGLF